LTTSPPGIEFGACPYSNATRGNIAVLLSVDGKPAR
jgi:hypothetical protein